MSSRPAACTASLIPSMRMSSSGPDDAPQLPAEPLDPSLDEAPGQGRLEHAVAGGLAHGQAFHPGRGRGQLGDDGPRARVVAGGAGEVADHAVASLVAEEVGEPAGEHPVLPPVVGAAPGEDVAVGLLLGDVVARDHGDALRVQRLHPGRAGLRADGDEDGQVGPVGDRPLDLATLALLRHLGRVGAAGARRPGRRPGAGPRQRRGGRGECPAGGRRRACPGARPPEIPAWPPCGCPTPRTPCHASAARPAAGTARAGSGGGESPSRLGSRISGAGLH